MNKSVMKCCICNNENIGEFITINDEKYHLCCIEKLKKENQELKEELEDMTLCRDIASGHRKEVQDRETILLKENKELKENLQQEKKDFKEANDYCFELKDYKSRCEKAIEYLDKVETLAMPDGKIIFSINTIRNILQKK